jgi:hypothetical protein
VSWYVDGYKVVIASTFFEPSILPAGSMKKAFVSGISSTVMTTTTKSALLFFKYDHRRLTKDQLLIRDDPHPLNASQRLALNFFQFV